jgi:hypothetical protein
MPSSTIKTPQLFEGEEFNRLNKIFINLTGKKVKKIIFPGLKNRNKNGSGSAIMVTENNFKAVLTYRNNINEAKLETEVLERLSSHGANVPGLIAKKGNWLVQEHIEGVRLSKALTNGNMTDKLDLVRKAVESLREIQIIGYNLNLNKLTNPISTGLNWRRGRINFPEKLGVNIQIPAPKLDDSALNDVLNINPDTFIKWDARSGNAILNARKQLFWFDWEHSGTRNSLDDLVWFFGDEWMPLNPNILSDLIDEVIKGFDMDKNYKKKKRYLIIHGTLHMCGRLSKILKHKGSKGWWKREYCLEFDQMGITKTEASILSMRIATLAELDNLTKPISDWSKKIHDKIITLK